MQMKHAVFSAFLILTMHTGKAQESLSKDVSYAYLEKLIAVCKANYPKIKMYEARVSTAENGIKRAKLSYFDIFSFSYLYSPNNNTATISPNFLGGYQFGFFANIGSILQKPSLIKQAKGELAAAQYDKESFDLNMEAEVKKRYFTYVQKIAVMRVRSGAMLDVESMASTIRHRFERGEESLENYNKVLIMIADHAQNILNAESDVLVAKSNLEELLGQKLEDIK
ncbi:TolC family protein [Dyadobacter sediminis]|uniref:TolC family protein n=2 Tax=Dyadobacter sediminis TaxID=1493691 RepID=A0A5R9KFJ5_9BACT|nr:TolC family protein [Dyadobacter sediminis]